MQVVLVAPHTLQARLEVVAQQLGPLLALDPASAPVKLEQDMGAEVAVDLVRGYVSLARSPEGGLRNGVVVASGAAHRGGGDVGGVVGLGVGLVAQPLGRRARPGD